MALFKRCQVTFSLVVRNDDIYRVWMLNTSQIFKVEPQGNDFFLQNLKCVHGIFFFLQGMMLFHEQIILQFSPK